MGSAVLAAQYVVGFVFVLSSIPKFGSRATLARAIENYGLLPAAFVRPVTQMLPIAELTTGLSLLLGFMVVGAAALAAALLLAFALAAGWNLLHGRVIDCGCVGIAAPRTISWGLVVRDVTLATLALVVGVATFAKSSLVDGTEATTGDILGLIAFAALLVVADALISEWWRFHIRSGTAPIVEEIHA